MRLVLGLALAAAAILPATASATDTCTPAVATIRVCVTQPECFRPWSCEFDQDASIDPQCTPMQPVSGPCAAIDALEIPLGPR